MKIYIIRKKWVVTTFIVLIAILILIMILKFYEDSYIKTSAIVMRNKTVVIDPGHGGFDPGAVSSSGTREDEINLKIAKKLGFLLKTQGVNVVMTREDNNAVAGSKREDMRKRADIISECSPNIVVSIHLNKFSQSQYYGAQTFYSQGSEEGKRLADCIQKSMISILNRGNKREIKPTSNIYILKIDKAPAVVVECGFLSNPAEEQLLKTADYQHKVAYSIYKGIEEYFK